MSASIFFILDATCSLSRMLTSLLRRYSELNPWFNILTVVRDSRFRFNVEDLKDLPGLNAMIYADDEEVGGVSIGAEGLFLS